MPNTRRIFGRGGTRFTDVYATTPLCCPSRASFATGTYAHNHQVRTNDDGMGLDQSLTIHRALQDAGYRTALVGKYLNRWDPAVDPPYLDRYVLWLKGVYDDGLFNVDGKNRTLPGYSTRVMTRRAIRILEAFEQRDDQPWFMWLAPNAPHGPFKPEDRYKDADVGELRADPARRDRDVSDEPEFMAASQVPRSWAVKTRRKQLRTLLSVDDQVQRMFRTLERLDEADNTLAIFVSDNGFLWGEHGITGKRYPYTQSIKIPLYMRWPARFEAGASDDRIVANIDVPATILDAAGALPASGLKLDGISLLGTDERDRILIEQWADDETLVPTMASLRTTDHQYVEYYADDGETITARAYYDLEADPWQRSNLLGDDDPSNDPDVEGMSAQIAADRRCRADSCP
jgi:arylsulfatase A-like enzyme